MATVPDQELLSRISRLETIVGELQTRLSTLEQQPEARTALLPPAPLPTPAIDEDVSEELISWVGSSSLLPRISTLCFLLVIALALRTVTDHEILARTTGSYLGMLYATSLIGGGWLLYRRSSPLAPVFAACGAVLMAVIIVEIHTHFHALPSIPAYIILLITGATMALISYLYRVTLPIILGTLGMGLAGVAIDYPDPVYPLLAALLLAANALGFGATQLRRCSWLRWILLLITMAMMSAWALKLGVKIPKNDTTGLYPDWFLASVAAIFLFFTAAATAAIFERGNLRTAKFDLCLPLINVLWVYPGVAYVVATKGGGLLGTSLIGLLVAGGHFYLMLRISNSKTAKGVGAFALAGTVLTTMSLFTLSGNLLFSLTSAAALALLLERQAARLQHGALRLCATLVQLASITLFIYMVLTSSPPLTRLNYGLAATLLAALSYSHYRFGLTFRPGEATWFYGRFDPGFRTNILLLLTALASSFFSLQAISHAVITAVSGDQPHALICADSVIINSAATALMLYAFFKENKDIRNIAILITLIGASKVFMFDMFAINGFPLVISVLIFGVAIFFESIIFSNLQPAPPARQQKQQVPRQNGQ